MRKSGTVNINTQSLVGRACADAIKYISNSNTGANSDRITVTQNVAGNCISEGDEVLIIKMQNDDVGRREFKRVARIAGSTILFTDRTTGAYDGRNGSVLVQRVPNYNSLTVPGGATLTADAFTTGNATGGVLALRVSGELNVAGTINMDQKGFRGGSQGSAAGPEMHTGRRASGGGTGGHGGGARICGGGRNPASGSNGAGGGGRAAVPVAVMPVVDHAAAAAVAVAAIRETMVVAAVTVLSVVATETAAVADATQVAVAAAALRLKSLRTQHQRMARAGFWAVARPLAPKVLHRVVIEPAVMVATPTWE